MNTIFSNTAFNKDSFVDSLPFNIEFKKMYKGAYESQQYRELRFSFVTEILEGCFKEIMSNSSCRDFSVYRLQYILLNNLVKKIQDNKLRNKATAWIRHNRSEQLDCSIKDIPEVKDIKLMVRIKNETYFLKDNLNIFNDFERSLGFKPTKVIIKEKIRSDHRSDAYLRRIRAMPSDRWYYMIFDTDQRWFRTTTMIQFYTLFLRCLHHKWDNPKLSFIDQLKSLDNSTSDFNIIDSILNKKVDLQLFLKNYEYIFNNVEVTCSDDNYFINNFNLTDFGVFKGEKYEMSFSSHAPFLKSLFSALNHNENIRHTTDINGHTLINKPKIIDFYGAIILERYLDIITYDKKYKEYLNSLLINRNIMKNQSNQLNKKDVIKDNKIRSMRKPRKSKVKLEVLDLVVE